jgi:hypothetical protein
VGGLAALAALLLLLFLKKRKPPDEVLEVVESETTLESTVVDSEEYISEYGLSDGVQPMDEDDDQEDLPQLCDGSGAYNSQSENVSEHNPEELDEPGFE